MMKNEQPRDKMAAWPESARRYVQGLKRALEVHRADLAHYMCIVQEHEYVWEEQELHQAQIEALGIENYKLKATCEELRERLRAARREGSPSQSLQEAAGVGQPSEGAWHDGLASQRA